MTDPKTKIAARIKEAREWKGLTQVHMAQQLKVARQTYLDLETGKTEPKVRLLSEISEITERPLTWFVYGDEGIEILESEYKEEMIDYYNFSAAYLTLLAILFCSNVLISPVLWRSTHVR